MKQLVLLLEESQASAEAKRLGLDYLSFGRYGKNGKQTHAVIKGKLVPIAGKGHTKYTKFRNTQKKSLPAVPKEKMTFGHDKYGNKIDPANWWRDAFYAQHGKMSKEEAMKLMKIHPDLEKEFKNLFGDYIHKDKTGNYEWPEMIELGI